MSSFVSEYKDQRSGVSGLAFLFYLVLTLSFCSDFMLLSGLYTHTHTTCTHTCTYTQLSKEEYTEKLKASTTLYVGNLSFYCTENQIYELFSMCGDVKRVIMGLDRVEKTPCGFCFIEYPTS